MSDDIEDIGPIEEAAPEAEPPEKVIPPEIVKTARQYGWFPEEESKHLPPGSWMDADAFVGAAKTRLRIQADEIADLRRRSEATETMAKQANDLIRRQERQRFEQELYNIRAAKEEAVEAADKEQYQRLDNYENQLRTAPQQPEIHPDTLAFKETPQGKEWMDDPILVNWARDAINVGALGKSPAEQMQWANEKVREYFPHKFQPKSEPPREENGRYTTSRVDGGGLAGGGRSSGLDADEREAFKVLKAKGVFKTESEYIAHARTLGVRE
jgi:hypothetical protein